MDHNWRRYHGKDVWFRILESPNLPDPEGIPSGAKEFERVVILDGDTLMLRSCDELFRLPTLLAAAPEMHRAVGRSAWDVGFTKP